MIQTTLCFIFKNDEVLMMYRHRKQDVHLGKWNALGGKFEVGETADECVKREVYEESGIRLQNPMLIGICHYPNFIGNLDEEMMYVYIGTTEAEPIKVCDEGMLAWKPKASLYELNMWESDKVFIPYVLKQIPFKAQFIYEDNRFISHTIEAVTEKELRV